MKNFLDISATGTGTHLVNLDNVNDITRVSPSSGAHVVARFRFNGGQDNGVVFSACTFDTAMIRMAELKRSTA